MATTHRVRPFVVAHNETSIDGRLALSPDVPLMVDGRWPGGDGYRGVIDRHRPTALIEGAGSFLPDSATPEPLPPPTQSPDELRADYLPDAARARAHAGWLVVTDSRGRIRWQFKEFPDPEWAGWHVLVLVAQATDPAYLEYLRREEIPYLVRGRDRVDLGAALVALHDVLGVKVAAATGGGRIGGALLRAGLIDEIEVEVLPIAVGGTRVPTLFTAPDLPPDAPPVPLILIGVEEGPGGRVLLRYEVG